MGNSILDKVCVCYNFLKLQNCCCYCSEMYQFEGYYINNIFFCNICNGQARFRKDDDYDFHTSVWAQ
jgi:hypothetical protein